MPSGLDIVNAIFNVSANAVIGTLQPRAYDRQITRIVITGPASTIFTMYRGLVIADIYQINKTSKGSSNTYDAYAGEKWSPLFIPSGESAILVWSGSTAIAGAKGTANINFQWGEQ